MTRSQRPITLYAIGGFTIIWWIVIFFMSIFQCKPVTGSIAFVQGSKCLPPLPFFYAQTIPNLITDFAILAFPVPTHLDATDATHKKARTYHGLPCRLFVCHVNSILKMQVFD